MLVAVMSDSHDNIWNLRKAVEIIKVSQAGLIIHCGDFIAPFMLKELDTAAIPVQGVFGNNDGDQHMLTKMSLTILKNVSLQGLVGQINVEGFSIGFTHYARMGEGLVSAGACQLVCFGHSHEHEIRRIENVTLLNPGEVMGKDGFPGFCFVDTDSGKIERVEL
jgi:putative phosphoesterase